MTGRPCSNPSFANAISTATARTLCSTFPGRILGWFAGADITKPEAGDLLTKAVKSGAIGFGELKSHVAAAGPKLRRVYALAAELGVPVLVHFQED